MKTINLKSGRAKAIAALVFLALLVGAGALVVSAQLAALPEVEATTVTRARITSSVTAVADIEAVSRSTISLSPAVKVVDVLVQEGQRVSKGDLLVVLDTSDYEQQAEQQGINLTDAKSMLRYLRGPSSSANGTSARNAVGQAQLALDNARSAYEAARGALANAPSFNHGARAQAEIALDVARVARTAAESSLKSAEELNEGAIRQAEIALDLTEDACDLAQHDVDALAQRLADGLITQAEYDAQYPALLFALQSAGSARNSAEVNLDTVHTTADANLAVAEKSVADARHSVESAEATLDMIDLKASTELRSARRAVADAQRAVRSAEITLSNARNSSTLARHGDAERVSNQKSQIALLDASLRYLWDKVDQGRLKAPVDGIVSRMDAEVDQYPQAGDGIVVEGTSGLVASFDVGQTESVGIKPGQRVHVTLKGIGAAYQGSVTEIAAVAKRSATSADQDPKIRVKASILDPDEVIRIGYEADVEVFLDDKEAALQIATRAVRNEGGTGRRFVLTLDESNRVGLVYVQTGIETGYVTEVLSGLVEGQRCILDPDETLRDGMTVRLAQAGR